MALAVAIASRLTSAKPAAVSFLAVMRARISGVILALLSFHDQVGNEQVVVIDRHLPDFVRRLLQPIRQSVEVADVRIG